MRKGTNEDTNDNIENNVLNDREIESEISKLLQNNIKILRDYNNLKYEDIRVRGGLSIDTIKQLFNSKVEINPRLKTIACLARAFNVPVVDLFNPNLTSFFSSSQTTNFSKYVGDYDAFYYSLDCNELFNGSFCISNQNILETELTLSNKKYTGALHIIFESNSAYSVLVDTESKNVKIISFKMDTSFSGNSILGLMLCFDNNGMPVVQRILFIKKKLNAINNDNYHNTISRKLLMNKDEIHITKEKLNELDDMDNATVAHRIGGNIPKFV